MLLYTMQKDKCYGSNMYDLQGSLAFDNKLAIRFSQMVIQCSSGGL